MFGFLPSAFSALVNPVNWVWVGSLSDFPTPIDGVIYLEANKTYFITTHIDLLGNRLIADGVIAILGSSSETSSITSTGLSIIQPNEALFSSNYTIPVQNITFTSENENYPILNLDADGNNGALDWYGVNFLNCPNIGVVKNYDNCIFINGAFLNSAELEFNGQFGTIAFETYLLLGRTGLTIIKAPATAVVNTRFRLQHSSVIVPAGGFAFALGSVNIFPNPESCIIERVNFSGGGQKLPLVLLGTNKALFIGCQGVPNRACSIKKNMSNNATVTIITTQNVAVPVSGTFITDDIEKFLSHATSEFVYDGASFATIAVSINASLQTDANNRTLRVELRVNRQDGNGFVLVQGASMRVRQQVANEPVNVSLSNVIEQTQPSFAYQIWVANESGTQGITATDMLINAHRVI
jgi:hypothetical protein